MNKTNIVYNPQTNEIGIILFEIKDKYTQGKGIKPPIYRMNLYGIWSSETCIRLNRKQAETLLASKVLWSNPQEPDLITLNIK